MSFHLQQLEIILNRMLAIPIDELELLDARLLHRTPKFNRPGKHTDVLIRPSIEAAGDDLLRVIFEIMKDGNMGIGRDLRPLLADLLIGPQIIGRKRIIGTIIIRAQQHAAHRVEGDRASNIRMLTDEVHEVARLGLGGRVRSRAMLVTFRSPARREVAIQIQALFGFQHFDRDAVVIFQQAFRQNTIVFSTGLDRVAAHHQTRLVRMRLPGAVWIFDAHLQDPPIAIEIFAVHETIHRVIGIWIVARARADDLRLVGQRPFRAIGVDARHDVKGARVQSPRDIFILLIFCDQRMDQIQCRGGCRDL